MKTAPLRLALVLWIAAVALVAATPASAQWKWRDAAGKLQYSDRPPPAEVPEHSILQRPGAQRPRASAPADEAPAAAAPPAARASAPAVDKELEERRRKEEQEQQAKRKAEEDKLAKQRAENCARARAYLQTLDSGVRIARTNDKGEREFLDDASRASEVRRARQVIATDCK